MVVGVGVDLEFWYSSFGRTYTGKYAEAQAHCPEAHLLKCSVNFSIRYWLSLSLPTHQATLTILMLKCSFKYEAVIHTELTAVNSLIHRKLLLETPLGMSKTLNCETKILLTRAE